MRVLAENKRKFLAAVAAVIVVLGIGFGIGVAVSSSGPTAQAASPPSQTAKVGSLGKAVSNAGTRLATVRRCKHLKQPTPFRRCVEGALR